MINCEINSAEGVEWLRIANRNFGDFRNKLVDGVEGLVKSFKEKLSRFIFIYSDDLQLIYCIQLNINANGFNNRERRTSSISRKDLIKEFIDEDTTINVLQRWLSATKIDELRARNSLSVLRHFIQEAFIINYTSRDTEKTKTLDNITRKIAVPSRNGKNFASNLQL